MAETKVAEVKKKGFFSRKKGAPAPAPTKATPPAAKPAAASKPAPAPAPVEPRLSLESMPEVEKRIDRMHATQRRASLLERYENKYGEKLEVPNVFLPVEEEKAEPQATVRAESFAAAASAAPKPAEAPVPAAKPAAAPLAEKPAAPALPPKDVKAPEVKPVAAAAKPAAAVAKVAAPADKPAAVTAKPAVEPSRPLQLPEGMTLGKYLWPQVWPFWGLPLRRYSQAKWPDKKNMVLAMTVVDIPLLVILSIPRLLGLFWAGLVIWAVNKFKKKKTATAEPAAVAAN